MKKKNDALLFKCHVCGAAIRPLTFFDGSVWCPNCKTNLFLELSQKAENRDHAPAVQDASFSISQELFAKYLCEGGGRDALRAAIDYCRKAAYALDPYALLNLGYFYSLGYVESVHVETGRSFAKLCFDLARKCAPAGDGAFVTLAESNIAALDSPLKKNVTSDAFYLTALLKRLADEERATAPRLGVFAIDNDGSLSAEEKGTVSKKLIELYKQATVYLLKPNADVKAPFIKITSSNQFAQCFLREDKVLWFAFVRKGDPVKTYKKALSSILKDESEIRQNLSVVISEVKKAGNRGADFSDQDVMICTFTEKLYRYYSIDKSTQYSAFDRLGMLYHRTQGE